MLISQTISTEISTEIEYVRIRHKYVRIRHEYVRIRHKYVRIYVYGTNTYVLIFVFRTYFAPKNTKISTTYLG